MTPRPGARGEWLAMLAVCAPYLQGGLQKCLDFSGAVAEMEHFGLQPAGLFAIAVIALELGDCALVLTGRLRWLGASLLAAFTLAATLLANRYWDWPPELQFAGRNTFFEHIALAGGLILVALRPTRRAIP